MNNINDHFDSIDISGELKKKIVTHLLEKGIQKVSKVFDYYASKIESKAKKLLKKEDYEFFSENYDFQIEESFVLRRILFNLKTARNWSKEINFHTSLKSKELKNVFVEIDLFLSPLKYRFDETEQLERISSKELVSSFDEHKIIFGGAGAGKTTLIKRICIDYLENPGNNYFSCPIVIRFREIDYVNHNYGAHFGLYPILMDLLGIKITFPTERIDTFHNEYFSLIKQTITSFLDDGKVLLIADGFDEIPDSSIKKRIENDFNDLALSLDNARFILTSRSNDFTIKLPNTESFEICPLNNYQIQEIIKKWLNDENAVNDLYLKIQNSPFYDTAMRPLTLSHLCAIYERRKNIPSKPRHVYDFVVNLLLETWDQERSIIRPSDYAEFYIEKKKEFLSNLAFWFSFHLQKNVFTTEELRKCYNSIHKAHNLPTSQAKKIVLELENHTGLFIQTGYNCFEFSHKSLQEFLTAKYLFSLPKIPENKIFITLPNETAIAVSLSSSPNTYFENFLINYKTLPKEFWTIFLSRLVDESPDFDDNPSVIVFFLLTIQELEYPIFKSAFISLLKKTNLGISIKSFDLIYPDRQFFKDQTRLTHKNLDKPINDRNYMPGVLIIDNELMGIITEN